ncbi:MAG: putative DNA binding domain-containing protein [Lachnospiraceae bacterium]|nr:putative DNA binding domain-containing protein [Lachnospiraceae bacterium]
MDLTTLQSILTIGETVAVEFKRCGNGIESDTYESVCSFLNRFGGDLFLGVLDDGTVSGVPEKSASDMVKNFISVVSNPAMFSPTVYLAPKIIEDEAGHKIIHVHVPPSAEVHSYKKVIYDRVDDADVKVTATSAIAQMYIRKQNIFTEKKIFPYAKISDLRLDLLPRVRQMAVNHAGGEHPWKDLNDEELLKSAGLYGTDMATGESGYNLAAIMLLGKDDVIRDVCPAYLTDALLRKVNVDRYDDREIVQTNLIESYDRLMEFARKHLLDKFFLEDDARVSLRNILAREMISNVLMHREFTSPYMAKFVIEKERMYVENANRATGDGFITPDNLEPNPKNPIIASFFRNIGLADTLGSGTRKLFKYSKYYSGRNPEFKEGDVFRIIVPLDDAYSFDYNLDSSLRVNTGRNNSEKMPVNRENMPENDEKASVTGKKAPLTKKIAPVSGEKIPEKNAGKKVQKKTLEQYATILAYMSDVPECSSAELCGVLNVKSRRIRELLRQLEDAGKIEATATYRNRRYRVKS